VDAPDGVDLHGDVDMERDGDDDEETDNQKEDEEVVEDEDEDEEQEQDEDNGKEPRTFGQGDMGNTSANDVDTMVYDQPIVLPEQVQEMRQHTSPQKHPAPAPQRQTPEPRPRPRSPETHPFTELEHMGIVTRQKPRPAVPTLREAEEAGNTSHVDVDVDVDQQLLIEWAAGC